VSIIADEIAAWRQIVAALCGNLNPLARMARPFTRIDIRPPGLCRQPDLGETRA